MQQIHVQHILRIYKVGHFFPSFFSTFNINHFRMSFLSFTHREFEYEPLISKTRTTQKMHGLAPLISYFPCHWVVPVDFPKTYPMDIVRIVCRIVSIVLLLFLFCFCFVLGVFTLEGHIVNEIYIDISPRVTSFDALKQSTDICAHRITLVEKLSY